jgi:hypothetical protein
MSDNTISVLATLNNAVENMGCDPCDAEELRSLTGVSLSDCESFAAAHASRKDEETKKSKATVVRSAFSVASAQCETMVFNMGTQAAPEDPFEDIRGLLDGGDVASIDPSRLIAFVTAGSPAVPKAPESEDLHVQLVPGHGMSVRVNGQKGRPQVLSSAQTDILSALGARFITDEQDVRFYRDSLASVVSLKGKGVGFWSALHRALDGETPDSVIPPTE